VEPVGFTKVSALGVEEQRVLTIVDITSPGEDWKRLGDGYRVEARFIIWEDDDVLQIPTNALFRYADGWAVFVIADGKAERRSVKVGQRSGLAAQILAGLSEGEVAIAHPSDSIDVGTGVRRR
jgi:HlyD family secretion protein